MEINSQTCTTREQSERLLALGLKKETADICYAAAIAGKLIEYYGPVVLSERVNASKWDIPAWSLHRLWELMPKVVSRPALHLTACGNSVFYCTEDNNEEYEKSFSAYLNLYDNMIDCIEWLINEGCINKEYIAI